MSRLGLRARLALALVGVAILAVGLATLLGNFGLTPRLNEAAHGRLQHSADHMAAVAAAVYHDSGGWTPRARTELAHLSELDGLRLAVETPTGTEIRIGAVPTGARASAPIVLAGGHIGDVVVAPVSGQLLTAEEAHLRHSLDRLHLAAGAASVAAALLLAFLVAQGLSAPLRRIRSAAQQIEEGKLSTRVELAGGPEVRAVGHALNRLAETLEHEEETRKQTVADLAHELRTPVHGLLSRIEAAEDGVLDPAENLAAMHAEALRLTRLLDDLARLAEAERPGMLVEKCPLDLAAVALAQAEVWRARFEEKGIVFRTELEPVAVAGDADRLSQVVANLLSNAYGYTEVGEVRVRVAREAAHALLEVADTGIGIAPDDLKHVFKRFWRGEKSRSRGTGGAGIGLAIVRELVRAHDGRIDVESVPGRGSTFRVLLPALAGGVHEIRRRPSQDLQPARRDS